nr:TonB-dependent receptor [Fulvivirga sedimenti]
MAIEKRKGSAVILRVTVLLTLLTFSCFGQSKVVLDGIIEDQQRQPIEGATILDPAGNLLAVTDQNGKFRVQMPLGTHLLTITHISFLSRTYQHNFQSPEFVRITLEATTLSLEEVIIRDNNPKENLQSTIPGASKLTIKNIEAIPAFLGEVDVIKAITLLPGVSTVGEGSSGFNVRGGAIDQNLVTIDGMQLFNTSHVLGFFSIFHPDATRDFTLYKGYIPAEYGGRASSVLAVNSLQGQTDVWSAEAGIGSVSGKLTLQGPITKKTSILAAARVTYSDWVLGLVNDLDIQNSAANFYDIFVRGDHFFNDKHHVMFSYLGSADSFDYSNSFGYDWSNYGFNFKYDFQPSAVWRFDVNANYLQYTNSLLDYQPGLESELRNQMEKIQLRVNGKHTTAAHELDFGLEMTDYNPGDEIRNPLNEGSFISPDGISRDRGRELAFYVQDIFKVSERFDINAGLRFNLYSQIGPSTEYEYDGVLSDDNISDTLFYNAGEKIITYNNLAPRIAFRYELSDQTVLKLAYNRMYQYIHLISNTTSPTPVDQWQVSTRYIPPTQSDNFSIGVYKNSKNDRWVTSVEAFYRKLDKVVEYQDFAELILQENIEAELLIGQGRAYGLEFFVKRLTPIWTGWVSYVYTRSEVSFPGDVETINSGDWFPAYYDQPHSFKFVSDIRMGKSRKGSFGSTIVYNTGRPITALTSDYLQGPLVVPHYSDRNEYRIPNYFRIDVSMTLGSIIRKLDDRLTISLYNLLGRRNAYSVFYQRNDNSPIPRAYKLSVLGSIFPSITYSLKLDVRKR